MQSILKISSVALLFLCVSCANPSAPPKEVNTAGEMYLESIRQDGLTRPEENAETTETAQ